MPILPRITPECTETQIASASRSRHYSISVRTTWSTVLRRAAYGVIPCLLLLLCRISAQQPVCVALLSAQTGPITVRALWNTKAGVFIHAAPSLPYDYYGGIGYGGLGLGPRTGSSPSGTASQAHITREGLYLYNGSSLTFIHGRTSVEEPVDEVVQDTKAGILIATSEGLSRFDGTKLVPVPDGRSTGHVLEI